MEEQPKEEEPKREYRNLSVAYDLGNIAFSDATNTVYTFHLDMYFQTYPLLLIPPPHEQPLLSSKTVVYHLAGSEEDESDEESEEEEEDEEENENELLKHEKKHFTHWFEVCYSPIAVGANECYAD